MDEKRVVLETRMSPGIQQGQPQLAETLPQLATDLLTDPTEILRGMPTQAVSPELLALLDILSTPILLFENSPAAEQGEAQQPLRKAA